MFVRNVAFEPSSFFDMQNSEGRNMSAALMILVGAHTLVNALSVSTSVIGIPTEQAPLARLLNGVE